MLYVRTLPRTARTRLPPRYGEPTEDRGALLRTARVLKSNTVAVGWVVPGRGILTERFPFKTQMNHFDQNYPGPLHREKLFRFENMDKTQARSTVTSRHGRDGLKRSATQGRLSRAPESKRPKALQQVTPEALQHVAPADDPVTSDDDEFEHDECDTNEFEHDECNPCIEGCEACDEALRIYGADVVAYNRDRGLVYDDGLWHKLGSSLVFATQPRGVVFED